MTQEFKHNAYIQALTAFLRVCKREKIYLQALHTIANKLNFAQTIPDNGYIFMVASNKKFWSKLEEKITKSVIPDMTRGHNLHANEEYDYLMHCVNAFVSWVIEHGVATSCLKGQKRQFNFASLGEQIFTLAGRKLFGQDFQIQEPQDPQININTSDAIDSLHTFVKYRLAELKGDEMNSDQLYQQISSLIREYNQRLLDTNF